MSGSYKDLSRLLSIVSDPETFRERVETLADYERRSAEHFAERQRQLDERAAELDRREALLRKGMSIIAEDS